MPKHRIEVEAEPNVLVTVERKVRGVRPEYQVFGEARCHHCRTWCHLGRGPFEFILKGKGLPFCVECTQEVASPEDKIGDV